MSRENFYIHLRVKAGTKDEPQKETKETVVVHHIVRIKENKEQGTTTVFLQNGDKLEVLDAVSHILQLGEKFGVLRELK